LQLFRAETNPAGLAATITDSISSCSWLVYDLCAEQIDSALEGCPERVALLIGKFFCHVIPPLFEAETLSNSRTRTK
jgi:hypothetical protein